MLTRCPRCETTFRVTPEQLKARQGRVRCGHCQNVFNAIDTLVEAPAVPVAVPNPPQEASAVDAALPATAVAPAPAAEAETPVEAPASPSLPESAHAPAEPVAVPEEPDASPDESSPEPREADEDTPALEPLLHEEPRQRTWAWAIGCLVAVLALLVQAAIHYRTELAVLYPGAKAALNAACAPFGCEVSLPRKSELVGIEASNLSPDASGKLALSATLKNRAPFTQQFPDLELTLSDTKDQPLVRRVLVPADYLAPEALAAGFGAGAELSVNLLVDAPGVPAAGYQLYLFYP